MTINGTAVNFGFTGAGGVAVTGLSGLLLQSAEHSKIADREEVRNGIGDPVMHGWHGQREVASLEWIVTGSGLADAITNTTIQTPGTILVITACASMPSLIATTWEVQSGAKVSGANVNAKRITLPLEKNAGITAVAPA